MEVEQDAHTITYEAFVEELDEGDSFTTSLVDVLVKVRSLDFKVSSSRLRGRHNRNLLNVEPDLTHPTVVLSLNVPQRACVCNQLPSTSTATVIKVPPEKGSDVIRQYPDPDPVTVVTTSYSIQMETKTTEI